MKVVVYTGTRNLYHAMTAAYNSHLEHSDVDKIYLLIEDDEFPYPLPDKVETINVSEIRKELFPDGGANIRTKFTPICLMRAAYTKVLPEDIDIVLQMDVDTIVQDDLHEIWETDLTGKWFAACPEYEALFKPYGPTYYNVGVALFNLKQIREDGADDMVIKFLNTNWVPYIDQDAWNCLGMDMATTIPVRCNDSFCCGHVENPAVVHYAGIADWQGNDLVQKYMDK